MWLKTLCTLYEGGNSGGGRAVGGDGDGVQHAFDCREFVIFLRVRVLL
jgi:hypothetical protein